jgi:hypothetical protein
MKTKSIIIGLVSFIMLLGIAAILGIFGTRTPLHYLPLAIVEVMRIHLEHESLPQDLVDLDDWTCSPIEPCAATTKAKDDKCLIIYDPEYSKDKHDWVVIVVGYDWESRRRGPYILWNDNTKSRDPKVKVKQFIADKANLKYYYFRRYK